jgi:endonuclease III
VIEKAAAKRERAGSLIDGLAAAYPDVRIELDFGSDVELLIAVILSAQCTDKRVNMVTPALFARYRSVEAYAAARPSDLHRHIRTCGLYRAKAKSIVAACRALVLHHGGRVPTSRAALHELPGVGAKTAGVVTLHLAGGETAFPVDTHVGRLARRMGLTRQLSPDKVERDLQKLLPPARWGVAHQLLVRHGRRCCTARTPSCAGCPVLPLCPRRGLPALG